MVRKVDVEEALRYYSALPYSVIVEQWDDGAGPYWVARIAEFPHCMIHGDTPEEAVKEIQEVKIDWIRSNLERGLRIPEPRPREYSGQIRLRIPPTIHRLLSYRAELENLSLNQYMAMTLARAVGHASEPGNLDARKKMGVTRRRLVKKPTRGRGSRRAGSAAGSPP